MGGEAEIRSLRGEGVSTGDTGAARERRKDMALHPGLRGQRRELAPGGGGPQQSSGGTTCSRQRGGLRGTTRMLAPFPETGKSRQVQHKPDEDKRVLSKALGYLGGSVPRRAGPVSRAQQ